MNCNIELHDELVDSGEISCPFCDKRLEDCLVKKHESCCDDRQIIITVKMCVAPVVLFMVMILPMRI